MGPLQPQEGLVTLGEVGLGIGTGMGIGLGLGIGIGTSGAAAACALSGSAWKRSGCTRRAIRRKASRTSAAEAVRARPSAP